MHNFELLLEEKEKHKNSNTNKDVLSHQKIIKNIESVINQIDEDMMILEKELYFQKKKRSPDAKTKEDIMKLLKNKFNLLKNKFKPKEEQENNKDKVQSIDEFLENNKSNNVQQRDIYEEEDQKIKDWENKKQQGDIMINEISDLVKGMNSDAKNLGFAIGEITKKTKKMGNKFNDTYDNTDVQIKRVDKLNKKI